VDVSVSYNCALETYNTRKGRTGGSADVMDHRNDSEVATLYGFACHSSHKVHNDF
jgi:hypothetical protein